MAQASSVQREPSMEEILASIRRIIEDNDPGVAAPQQHEVAKASPPAGPSEVEDNGAASKIEAFRDSIEQDAPVSQPHPVQPPKTMTDLQASLQHSAEKGEVVRMPVAPASSAVAEDSQPAFAAAPHLAPEAEASGGARQPDNSASSVRPADANRGFRPAEDTHALREPSAGAGASAGAAAAPPSIISEKAGRQVAAAFEELSEAFAASRRRSFDEMAEEMLRPMLREWMDNNLPVLVERLVREEIERVARGVER